MAKREHEHRQGGSTKSMREKDVWLDHKLHPGTKKLRRAIRNVLDDYQEKKDGNIRYNRAIYKTIKTELQGRRFYRGKTRDRTKECTDEYDLMERIGESFEAEKERRLEKKPSKRSLVQMEEEESGRSSNRGRNSDSRQLERQGISRRSLNRRSRSCEDNSDRDSTNRDRRQLKRQGSRSQSHDDEDESPHQRCRGRERKRERYSKQRDGENDSPDSERPKTSRASTNRRPKQKGQSSPRSRRGEKSSETSEYSLSRKERKKGSRRSLTSTSCESDTSTPSPDYHSSRKRKSPSRQSKKSSRRSKSRREPRDIDNDHNAVLDGMEMATTVQKIIPGVVVYLDDEHNHSKGALALRATVRKVAIKLEGEEYSRFVCQQILKNILVGTQIFESKSCKDEMSKKELLLALSTIYEEERYMLRRGAPRDVYFDVPSHVGTKAWVKATQQVVIKYQHSGANDDNDNDKNFDRNTFRRIQKRLYDSSYYVGRPSSCERASKQEMIDRFGQRFEKERLGWMERSLQKEERGAMFYTDGRLIKRSRSDHDEGQQQLSTSDRGNNYTEGATVVIPIPGYLYWGNLGRFIAKKWRSMETIHRHRRQLGQKIAASQMVVKCQPCYLKVHSVAAPRYQKVRRFWRTDPRTGETWYEKIATQLEVTMFGHTSSWPMLVLLFMSIVTIVFTIWYSILKKIMLSIVE